MVSLHMCVQVLAVLVIFITVKAHVYTIHLAVSLVYLRLCRMHLLGVALEVVLVSKYHSAFTTSHLPTLHLFLHNSTFKG